MYRPQFWNCLREFIRAWAIISADIAWNLTERLDRLFVSTELKCVAGSDSGQSGFLNESDVLENNRQVVKELTERL